MSIFKRVRQFNADAGTQLDNEQLDLNTWVNEIHMLEEELDELKIATFDGVEWQQGRDPENPLSRTFALRSSYEKQREDMADALGDIIYVAMGTMAKLGINYERVMDEICTSNESKYAETATGKQLLKDENGKIQKGPNYKKPDLSFVSEIDNGSKPKGVISISSSSDGSTPVMTTTFDSGNV